jgi:hypothetical protein
VAHARSVALDMTWPTRNLEALSLRIE